MVPVRKPGRPLSTCPHPPDKNCPCRQRVTAALPKSAPCRCSVPPKPNGAANIVKAESSDNAPLSSMRHGSFRVQKSTALKPGRKPSVDTAALQRMNANSLNVMGAGNILPVAPENTIGQMNSLAQSGYAHYGPSLQNGPLQNGLMQNGPMQNGTMQNGAHHYAYQGANPTTGGIMNMPLLPMNGGMASVGPAPSSSNGIPVSSDMGSGMLTPSTSNSAYHTPNSSTGESSSQEPSLNGVGSCCSRQPQPQPHLQAQQAQMQFHGPLTTGPQQPPNMMGYMPAGNGPMVQPFPQQMLGSQQSYSMNQYQAPDMFPGYPALGTPNFPLQQSQWEQLAANVSVGANGNAGTQGPCTDHVCHCGPSCSCIGCIVHPYNQATRNYIQEIMEFQNDPTNGTLDGSMSVSDPPLATGETSQTQTPPDVDSPETNDPNLSPSEFLFVDYGGAMCGCGDGCECINCVIHRDPHNNSVQDDSSDNTPNLA